MATIKVSTVDVINFTSKEVDRTDEKTGVVTKVKTLRKQTSDGYIDVSQNVLGAVNAGMISHFEYDDAKGIPVNDTDGNPILRKDGKPVMKYSLSAIESAKSKMSKMAGSDQLNFSDTKTFMEVNELIAKFQ